LFTAHCELIFPFVNLQKTEPVFLIKLFTKMVHWSVNTVLWGVSLKLLLKLR